MHPCFSASQFISSDTDWSWFFAETVVDGFTLSTKVLSPSAVGKTKERCCLVVFCFLICEQMLKPMRVQSNRWRPALSRPDGAQDQDWWSRMCVGQLCDLLQGRRASSGQQLSLPGTIFTLLCCCSCTAHSLYVDNTSLFSSRAAQLAALLPYARRVFVSFSSCWRAGEEEEDGGRCSTSKTLLSLTNMNVVLIERGAVSPKKPPHTHTHAEVSLISSNKQT